MGRLTRIENTVNSSLSTYGQVKIVPRGLPYFIDNLLRGEIRFGRRTGNSTAVMNPDNTYKLANTVERGAGIVELTTTPAWISPNSIVSVGLGKELRLVADVIDSTIVLNEVLKFAYEQSDFLLLHSSPIVMLATATKGSTTVQVKSKYSLGNGDTFVYQLSPGLLNSISEIKAPTVSFGGTTGDPAYPKVYVLNLEKPLERDLEIDEMVYFRAYPAYFSNRIRVPNPVNSSDQMGPFLIDNLSGRLVEGPNFDETLAIKLIDRRGNYIQGDDLFYTTINKNFHVLRRPIRAHSFLFFDVAKGEMRFTPQRLVMSNSEENLFRIGQKMVPPLPANGVIYKFTTRSTVNAEMRIFLHPYETPILLNIKPEPQTHEVVFPTDITPIQSIEITVISETADVYIEMGDWAVDATVNEIEYSLVVEATGFAGYQSTGLLLKPLFLSTDLLQGQYDSGDSYDMGFIYF